jgi:hypothetical protein
MSKDDYEAIDKQREAARAREHSRMVEPLVWAIIYAGATSSVRGAVDPVKSADRGLALYRERFVNDPEASATGDDA